MISLYVASMIPLVAYAIGWWHGWRERDRVARGWAMGMPPEYFAGKKR